MEKKERTKYYPLSLKSKELHDRFVIEQKIKSFQNVDQMIEYLLGLKAKNDFLEKRCTQKENDFNEVLENLGTKMSMIEKLEEELKTANEKIRELDEENNTLNAATSDMAMELQRKSEY